MSKNRKEPQLLTLSLASDKKIYFASDNHLGAPTYEQSKEREKKFISWLDEVKKDAQVIFLLGDLFDFWFEYDKVIPKGFVRVLGKLSELTDAGIQIYFFVGNHDLWLKNYFQEELGIPTFYKPIELECNGKRFLIGHGDGLGPKDIGYKRMKKIFTNKICQFLFKWIHPDIGVRLAQYMSVKNKLISGKEDVIFLGNEKEWLVQYCLRKLQEKDYNYFVFGHRHLPLSIELPKQAMYINTGDWISYFSYAVFDSETMHLKYYTEN